MCAIVVIAHLEKLIIKGNVIWIVVPFIDWINLIMVYNIKICKVKINEINKNIAI